jgi:protein JSN1
MFNPATVQIPPINLQQLQYQQSLLARAAPPMNNFYPNMQSGFGYNSGSPSVEHYRNQTNPIQPPQPQMNPSPILGQSSFGPPGFGNIGMGINAYGYAGIGMQGMGYIQQEQQVNGRRGRVR